MRKVAAIKSWVDDYDAVVKAVEDLRLMPEFVEAGLTTEAEMDAQYAHTTDLIEKLELRNMLRSEEEQVRELVVRCMEDAAELRVRLIAECGVGANWVEAH